MTKMASPFRVMGRGVTQALTSSAPPDDPNRRRTKHTEMEKAAVEAGMKMQAALMEEEVDNSQDGPPATSIDDRIEALDRKMDSRFASIEQGLEQLLELAQAAELEKMSSPSLLDDKSTRETRESSRKVAFASFSLSA